MGGCQQGVMLLIGRLSIVGRRGRSRMGGCQQGVMLLIVSRVVMALLIVVSRIFMAHVGDASSTVVAIVVGRIHGTSDSDYYNKNGLHCY